MSADPVDLGAARRSPPAGRLAAASDVRALAAMVDREATPALLAALRERDFPRTRVLARSAEGDEAAAALDAAGATLAAAQGPDPAAWRADATAERIKFTPLPLITMRYTNRPSGIQIVTSFSGHAAAPRKRRRARKVRRHYAACPSGVSARAAC